MYAGRHGIIGALTEDLIDTSEESAATIVRGSSTAWGAPGSARDRLKSVEESRAQYARLVEVFKAHSIGYFFYNGGDSATLVSRSRRCVGTTRLPYRRGSCAENSGQRSPITDCCPGFGSVVKYGDQHSRGGLRCGLDGEDIDPGIHPGGDGSSRGWITAACGARRREGGRCAPCPAVPRDYF